MGDDRAERLAVPLDRGVEVVHRDGHVVDLGQQAAVALPRVVLHVDEAHECLRKRAILSSPTLARNSGSSIPSPSSGARHSTPILPSCRLRCTWYAASPTSSRRCTADRIGWIRPWPMSLLASHASR